MAVSSSAHLCNGLYAYIKILDGTNRCRLLNRGQKDSLFISKEIYHGLKSGRVQRNARFLDLSELDEVEKNVHLMLSA